MVFNLLIRISVSPARTTSISQLNLEETVEGYSHGIYETDPLYLDRKSGLFPANLLAGHGMQYSIQLEYY